jgi:phosphoglycolate phosphatase-like HAD superfamily hydrolase
MAGPHHDGLLRVVALTHAGMTTTEFDARVTSWLETARHPRWSRAYDQLTYQPMQELLAYLRADGFKTFIVSGGGTDFMRVWAERVYGIPPERVVGSTGRAKFEMRDDAHPPATGTLVTALAAAASRGWTMIDMKNDWKHVFKN